MLLSSLNRCWFLIGLPNRDLWSSFNLINLFFKCWYLRICFSSLTRSLPWMKVYRFSHKSCHSDFKCWTHSSYAVDFKRCGDIYHRNMLNGMYRVPFEYRWGGSASDCQKCKVWWNTEPAPCTWSKHSLSLEGIAQICPRRLSSWFHLPSITWWL